MIEWILPTTLHFRGWSATPLELIGIMDLPHWVIRLIEDDGWFMVRINGSHRQYHHPSKTGTVTISGNPGVDMPKGTLNSVLKQSGLKD